MADEELTQEQLAELSVADEETETPSNYKVPAKKTLEEIVKQDEEDESLAKYKKTLLGNQAVCSDPNSPNVQLTKMTLDCKSSPGDLFIDLTGDLSGLKSRPFVLKEGVEYRINFSFFVNKEIVSGLKYIQETYRNKIKVDKTEYMAGSYPPNKDKEHHFLTNMEQAPHGTLGRGNYVIKSSFTDDDKHVHLCFTWSLSIKKDW
ncbi:rho GDP-dissociation inhibitor 1-like [Antennarius striatus]|uniref:rho GDP-dissociation inhibitor 1-like n=1 Tax=Antennarius striatus TaxID=241820 RepID=UPI0035B18783